MKKLVLAILALIFAIGSIGAFEANTIGFGQCFIQVGIAVVVEYLALKSLDK